MKLKFLFILLLPALLVGCGSTSPNPPAGGTFTADFTVKHTQEGDIKPTGDTDNSSTLMAALNNYFFTDKNVNLLSIDGGFMNIDPDKAGLYVTETRRYDQLLYLGARKQDLDVTLTFEKEIKTLTMVCEAYSKYVSYNSTQNVDRATYLTINDEKKDIVAHTIADVDETQNLVYTINSKTVHMVAPNENTGDLEDKQGNRIIVYQMIFEY